MKFTQPFENEYFFYLLTSKSGEITKTKLSRTQIGSLNLSLSRISLFDLTPALSLALQHNKKEGEKKKSVEEECKLEKNASSKLGLALFRVMLLSSFSFNLVQHKLKRGREEDSCRLAGSGLVAHWRRRKEKKKKKTLLAEEEEKKKREKKEVACERTEEKEEKKVSCRRRRIEKTLKERLPTFI